MVGFLRIQIFLLNSLMACLMTGVSSSNAKNNKRHSTQNWCQTRIRPSAVQYLFFELGKTPPISALLLSHRPSGVLQEQRRLLNTHPLSTLIRGSLPITIVIVKTAKTAEQRCNVHQVTYVKAAI